MGHGWDSCELHFVLFELGEDVFDEGEEFVGVDGDFEEVAEG